MKVVINSCFGGFGLSVLALKELSILNAKCLKHITPKSYYGGDNEKYSQRDEWEEKWKKDFAEYKDIGDGFMSHPRDYNLFKDGVIFLFNDNHDNENKQRADKDLVDVVNRLGKEANGMCANLKVIEIPDDIEWVVTEYDGFESVEEKHRSWS